MAAPKKSRSSVEKKSSKVSVSPAKVSSGSFPAQAIQSVENMYALHLALLLIMTVLASLLLVVVVQQKQSIDSLRFRVNFLSDRYGWEKQKNGANLDKLEEGNGAALEEELIPSENNGKAYPVPETKSQY